jgi:hypothetical protein
MTLNVLLLMWNFMSQLLRTVVKDQYMISHSFHMTNFEPTPSPDFRIPSYLIKIRNTI